MNTQTYFIQIYPSDLSYASRINRISTVVYQCIPSCRVLCIGLHEGILPEIEKINESVWIWRIKNVSFLFRVPFFGRIFFVASWGIKIYRKLRSRNIKNIIAVQSNSILDLSLSYFLSRIFKANLFYDAHELETERLGLSGIHKWYDKTIEKIFIKKASKVFVVCDSIKNWYELTYPGISITVIKNIPSIKKPPSFIGDYLRRHFNIPINNLIFVYIGKFMYNRGIELSLDAFKQYPNHHIVFLGYGYLKDKIILYTKKFTNIHFHEAVLPDKIADVVLGADIGVVLIEKLCLNDYYCLPNKLWESLKTGLPVLGSDFPEIRKVIQGYNVGWVISPDQKNLMDFLRNINFQTVSDMKKNLLSVSLPTWDDEAAKLSEIYKKTLQKQVSA